MHPEFIVTVTVAPVLPEEGEGEQPVIVHMKDGAPNPDSATVTVMGTVTEAAWTGPGRKVTIIRNKPTNRIIAGRPDFGTPGRIVILSQD